MTTICVGEEGKTVEKAVQIKPEAAKITFREMLTCVADEECADKPEVLICWQELVVLR